MSQHLLHLFPRITLRSIRATGAAEIRYLLAFTSFTSVKTTPGARSRV